MKKGFIITLFCFFSIISLYSQSIKIIAPKEGAVLTAGQEFKITWVFKGPISSSYVRIWLYNASGTKRIAIITEQTAIKTNKVFIGSTFDGIGKFTWKIPIALFQMEGEHIKKAMRRFFIRVRTANKAYWGDSKLFYIKPKIIIEIK